MPVATGTALAIAGGMGGLGALAGSMGSKSTQNYEGHVNAGSATGAENAGQSGMLDAYKQLQGMAGAGPGQQDVANAYGAQTDLAKMLQQYSQGGYAPGQSDINSANSLAGQLFQAQRTQLGQNFTDQSIQANRQAALMGRDPNDPVLRNKLAQEQTRQQQMLDANQGSWATQYAMQQPMQRLDFAQQRTSLLGGLATQAMQNRQAIAAMGEGIMNNERNFRLQTASRYGQSAQQSGGGLSGALTGFLGGAGAGMGMMKGFIGGGAPEINGQGGVGTNSYGPPVPAGFVPPGGGAGRAPASFGGDAYGGYPFPAGPPQPAMGMGASSFWRSNPYSGPNTPGMAASLSARGGY